MPSTTHSPELLARLPNAENAHITNCKDSPRICGSEAACREFSDNTSKCVCPHDLSPPTADLQCPNRLIGKQHRFQINIHIV